MHPATGEIIDHVNGRADIQHKMLRAINNPDARLSEDRLRLLRAVRFAARFAQFNVASGTLQLMCDMVQAGEVQHLVAERVWQEIAKGLMEHKPSRMLEILRDCGVHKMRLMGNPRRMPSMTGYGLEITGYLAKE
ncbi:hypothetical protein [uncultured Limnohabitans sp.]|uniref:hypothetical protein n=1 Tax=uncultured Limnohabitans sp. TaxID=768543 RepID=UPI003412C0E3